MYKLFMALDKSDKKWLKDNFATKDDLETLSTKKEIKTLATKKDLKKIDKKLDKFFNYLDKDVSHFKRKVATHLDIPVSELSVASD